MHKRARVDANQSALVAYARVVGFTVQHTHQIGGGCPDLVVGFQGFSDCWELKDGKGQLTPDERQWHDAWRGAHCVIRTESDIDERRDFWLQVAAAVAKVQVKHG